MLRNSQLPTSLFRFLLVLILIARSNNEE